MVAKEFNPFDHAREPREEGWREETERIIKHIRNRGDLRIGQLLINAISQDIEHEEPIEIDKQPEEMMEKEAQERIKELEKHRYKEKAKVEQKIWNVEANKLLKLLDQIQDMEED